MSPRPPIPHRNVALIHQSESFISVGSGPPPVRQVPAVAPPAPFLSSISRSVCFSLLHHTFSLLHHAFSLFLSLPSHVQSVSLSSVTSSVRFSPPSHVQSISLSSVTRSVRFSLLRLTFPLFSLSSVSRSVCFSPVVAGLLSSLACPHSQR